VIGSARKGAPGERAARSARWLGVLLAAHQKQMGFGESV